MSGFSGSIKKNKNKNMFKSHIIHPIKIIKVRKLFYLKYFLILFLFWQSSYILLIRKASTSTIMHNGPIQYQDIEIQTQRATNYQSTYKYQYH